MSVTPNSLPLTETIVAETAEQVVATLQAANADGTAVYPIGGGTSLDFGLPVKRPGVGLQLTGLDKIVEYPARDMTITVGAGVTLAKLQHTLAAEGQRLPIDVPCTASATLGGLIASNHSGPLRFGHGTMRDHVIGIRAVDGRGEPFAGGGRVVKNVAGYDFCKLLTGSLGTLGVITEVTLKLKPIPAARALISCQFSDFDHVEAALASLVHSAANPVAIEVVSGSNWEVLGPNELGCLIVGLEGTEIEVEWMLQQLSDEWRSQAMRSIQIHRHREFDRLYSQLVDFSADNDAPLILKSTGVASGITRIAQAYCEMDSIVSLQSHAGNGVVLAKFAEFPPQGLSRVLDGGIAPLAAAAHGVVTVLSNPGGEEATPHSMWGPTTLPPDLVQRVKAAFDPNRTLNPGRFFC